MPFTLLILCLVAVAGCNKEPAPAPQAPTASAPAPAAETSNVRGAITGIVVFTGSVEDPVAINNVPCHDNANVIYDETLIVNATSGGLKNAVVYLKQTPPGTFETPAPAALDQRNCQYIPHVLAMMTGQNLNITSSDPTLHNVHMMSSLNPAQNLSFTQPGMTKSVSFKMPEFIKAKCDVHPWMLAHIAVFPHPFFFVTRDDGLFSINQVPAGDYTLIGWHEKFGLRQKDIRIENETPLEVKFEYAPPKH